MREPLLGKCPKAPLSGASKARENRPIFGLGLVLLSTQEKEEGHRNTDEGGRVLPSGYCFKAGGEKRGPRRQGERGGRGGARAKPKKRQIIGGIPANHAPPCSVRL